jgi:hypothetical protein
MARLDLQRRTIRPHTRLNARKHVRGYDTTPHEPWGDSFANGATYPATTGYAGTPGSFGPSGCTTPANAAAVATLVASPQTAWTTGQHCQSATAGLTGRAYWNATAWVTGAVAP